jgi:hypothetical protein
MTFIPPLENTFREPWPPTPRLEEGQLIWNIGRIEITTTRSKRDGGPFAMKVPPKVRHKGNPWKLFDVDDELYFDKLLFLGLDGGDHRFWWRMREQYNEGVR